MLPVTRCVKQLQGLFPPVRPEEKWIWPGLSLLDVLLVSGRRP